MLPQGPRALAAICKATSVIASDKSCCSEASRLSPLSGSQQRRIATRDDKTVLSSESLSNLAAARLQLKSFQLGPRRRWCPCGEKNKYGTNQQWAWPICPLRASHGKPDSKAPEARGLIALILKGDSLRLRRGRTIPARPSVQMQLDATGKHAISLIPRCID